MVPSVFNIDARKAALDIGKFISSKMIELRRDGIVTAVSGGLDSSTVLGLCVRAVGGKKVTALMLPEKKGNPDALKYAKIAAKLFGSRTAVMDITPVLEKMGVYRFITNYIPGRKLTKALVSGYMRAVKSNPFIERIRGTGNRLTNSGIASMDTKHRVRLAMIYKFAEERNLLVVGSAHRSEDLLGLFCKFGVDDNADVMPVKNLYRSQILRLAEFIGVPAEILAREPNPDMIPGIEDKYFDVLGIHSDIVDLILYGLERKMRTKEIARKLHLTEDKVNEISEIIKLTEHMRNPSIAPLTGL